MSECPIDNHELYFPKNPDNYLVKFNDGNARYECKVCKALFILNDRHPGTISIDSKHKIIYNSMRDVIPTNALTDEEYHINKESIDE